MFTKKLPDDLLLHSDSYLDCKDSIHLNNASKYFKELLKKDLPKKNHLANHVDSYLDSLKSQKSTVGRFHRFVNGLFNPKDNLRNLILQHAHQINPVAFQEKICSQGLFKNSAHKPNDSHITEDKICVVTMNDLSLTQVTALAEIYNDKYPTLNMRGKRLGFVNDLNGTILSETCILRFNADIFMKEILPMMKGIEDKSSHTNKLLFNNRL